MGEIVEGVLQEQDLSDGIVRGNVPSVSKVDAEGRDRCTIGI